MDNSDIAKHFWCAKDKHYFLTDDYTGGDIALSKCEICGGIVEEVPHYYANLDKMHKSATGPVTQKGKDRSKMNSYKHGMRSRQLHLLAPAIPGRYPECSGCQYGEECKDDYKYCPVIVQPMMQFIKAYEEGNSADLRNFAGFTHARIFQILQIILKEIVEKGTLQPKVINTKYIAKGNDDKPAEEETVLEWQRNPLLSQIEKLMQVLGFHADQQNMTPAKNQDQENTDGFIQAEKDKIETDREFEERRTKAMEAVKSAQIKAIENRKNDDLLNEFNQEEIKEKDVSKDSK
ncbi:hypothetical protein KAR91_48475 [Candidatus Pacearchaeota archaeon]|nr:hypothetical protein [Candidatus Pacearchaeota archaeon]